MAYNKRTYAKLWNVAEKFGNYASRAKIPYRALLSPPTESRIVDCEAIRRSRGRRIFY